MEFRLKRLFTIPIYLLLFCGAGNGQNAGKSISFCISQSFATLYGNDKLEGFKPIAALAAGITYKYCFSPEINIKTGITAEQKGAQTEVQFFDNDGNYLKSSKINFNRSYLTVPFSCVYVFRWKLKLYLGAGIYLSYLLDAKDKNSQSDDLLTLSGQTKTMDYGSVIETGVLLPLNKHFDLDIGIKACIGLRNTLLHEVPARNNTIGAQLAINWNF